MNNDNQHDAPPELLAQAYRIALYFAERGIKNWTLGPVTVAKVVPVAPPRATPVKPGCGVSEYKLPHGFQTD